MTFHFIAKLLPAALVVATLLITGCGDKGGPADKAPLAVSMAAVATGASGFTAGAVMSARTVYVFFDAQCSHCAELWRSAKPLQAQAKFIWIPVGMLSAASTAQGATLLAAPNPVAAMDQHEASMAGRQGGISAAGNIDVQKALVIKNTELLKTLGFNSIPTLIATHAVTGALVTREGTLPTAALAEFLGLQWPSAGAIDPAQ